MENHKFIQGFSKLSREQKSDLIAELSSHPDQFKDDLKAHLHPSLPVQTTYESFSENTITNYFLPFGVAPNFLINNKVYHVPMVVEESSVVAAASAAAKFWSTRGGFKAQVSSMIKKGQVHFKWAGRQELLQDYFNNHKPRLQQALIHITRAMENRGGGITNIRLFYLPDVAPDYYQLDVEFDTVDAMGANFINTVLEQLAIEWKRMIETSDSSSEISEPCSIIMSILSNYTPECLVECRLEVPLQSLNATVRELSPDDFADRFQTAFEIAKHVPDRAVTHNKGIMNGIDAVALATGNDFRAIEANAHAYASRNGRYSSLSEVSVENDNFSMSVSLPLAVGTVGGITNTHPMVKHALNILGDPTAKELMEIMAAVGLASNFSAVKALISGGIQAGHMKLHLSNILVQLGANTEEEKLVQNHFLSKTVSFSLVKDYLQELRQR